LLLHNERGIAVRCLFAYTGTTAANNQWKGNVMSDEKRITVIANDSQTVSHLQIEMAEHRTFTTSHLKEAFQQSTQTASPQPAATPVPQSPTSDEQ
jgi:hypothetical protein